MDENYLWSKVKYHVVRFIEYVLNFRSKSTLLYLLLTITQRHLLLSSVLFIGPFRGKCRTYKIYNNYINIIIILIMALGEFGFFLLL